MKRKHFSYLLGIALVFGLWSCQNEDAAETSVKNAEDEAVAEALFAQTISEADNLGDFTALFGDEPGNIAVDNTTPPAITPPVTSGTRVVTVTPQTGFPRTVTIVFTNWKVGEQREKNGTIRIVHTGPMHRIGTTRTMTYENFSIGGNKIEGTKVITNVDGLNLSVSLTGGKITFLDGTTITRTVTRNREWIAGMNTPRFIWDDEYRITGTVSGVNRAERPYSVQITKPLIRRMACLWIVEGIVLMTNGDRNVILDYGTGTCDDLATVTANGETREITLPRTPPRRRP
ncbi:MAG TPA: hypothetical protein DCM62_04375 [Bacteroidales bacterium]|nr:hypothetical protein [Bacteroidales bacterium]